MTHATNITLDDLLKKNEYKFLQEKIDSQEVLYLTLAGSISYGTNHANSDIDIRGIMATPETVLFGDDRKFEQLDDKKTDTVIYTTNKYLRKLYDCNPNMVQLMGSKKEHMLYTSPVGQMILDNYQMFLSQKIFYTFEGYAMGELNKLKDALSKNSDDQSIRDARTAEKVMNMLYDFNTRYEAIPEGHMEIYTGVNKEEESALYIDLDLKGYPLKDLTGMFSEIGKTVKDFERVVKPGIDGLNKRNRKKTPEKLDKHASLLIMMYIMSIELGSTGEMVTYRKNERDFLTSVKNGHFRKSDGTYDSAFFEMIEEYKVKLNYVRKNTILPVKADLNKTQEFLMDINRRTLGY